MRYALIAILAFLSATTASLAQDGTGAPRSPLVTAELVPLATSVSPGGTIAIAVRLKIAAGWHVYWKNPGDAGMPTRVKWTAPAGAVVGELKWPIPVRFTDAGDIVGYGYKDDVSFVTAIGVPADATVGKPFDVSADVSWLSCKDVCIPGKATLSLAIPIAAKSETSPEAEALVTKANVYPELEQREWTANVEHEIVQLPQNAAGEAVWDVVSTITWKQPPAEVEWFPFAMNNVEIAKPTVETAGNRTTLRGRISTKTSAFSLDGVIAFRDAAGRRYGLKHEVTSPFGPLIDQIREANQPAAIAPTPR